MPTTDVIHGGTLGMVLGDIGDHLDRQAPAMGPDLASGLAGAALFHGHLAAAGFETGPCLRRADEALERAMDAVEGIPAPSLFGGYVGLAWVLEQLQALRGDRGEDLNADTDELLLDQLDVPTWTRDYDLINGLVGCGAYALERLPRPSARLLLRRVLDHLEALAVPEGPGLAWPTAPRLLPPWQQEEAPEGYLNLGLAHGVPGVLVLLAAMVRLGLDPARSGGLLSGGLRWFMAQVPEGLLLPSWRPVGGAAEPGRGRAAWCYGGLGAGWALLLAATLAPDLPESPAAAALGRALGLARAVEPGRGILDASLCHGYGGNAVLFGQFHRATGDRRFGTAAAASLALALGSRRPGTGAGGFRAHVPAGPGDLSEAAYQPLPGLLEGAAGVGLALLSAAGGSAPTWGRALFLDVPCL